MAKQQNDNYIFKLCTVEYVDDESKALRIKVRIHPYDDGKEISQEPTSENNNNGVPWCFPLLPKMLHVNPRVGELVVVFCQEPGSPLSQRLFFGPVISQDYMMDYDFDFVYDTKKKNNSGELARNMLIDSNYLPSLILDKSKEESTVLKSSARRMLTGNAPDKVFSPFPSPDGDGENEGTIPEREDIAIRGRGNSDFVLTDNDIRMRCGFKKTPHSSVDTKLHFNSEDLSYILMRYRKGKDEVGEYNSSVNIVADRINLLSHDSKDYFDLGDRKDLITDKEMENILSKAHELPYGDVLVDFLKKFIDVFNRHTHPFSGKEPSLNAADTQTLAPNWENMLSKSVRIN